MRQFKDNKDRTWDVAVNVGTAKRARDVLNVDLFKLYGDEAGRVFGDPILLVNLLYVLCEPQCKANGISDVEFGEAMVGDAIEDGANALMESVADFFPSSKRQVLQKIKAKGEEVSAKMVQRAEILLDQVANQMLTDHSTSSERVTS